MSTINEQLQIEDLDIQAAQKRLGAILSDKSTQPLTESQKTTRKPRKV